MVEKGFKKGEIIFYPEVGLGEIIEVEKKIIDEDEVEVFKIRIFSNNSEIFVPIDDLEKLNIRHLINKDEIDKIYDYIKNDEFKIEWNWKKRYKYHDQLFLSGLPEDMILILKNLTYIQHRKGLTKKELKFKERVLDLLAEELSQVSGEKRDDIYNKIEKALDEKIKNRLKKEKTSK